MKPLHFILSNIVYEQILENNISPTPTNCVKYCTRSVLRNYSIRDDTPVSIADWKLAIVTAKERLLTETAALDEPRKTQLSRIMERYRRGQLGFDELLSLRFALLQRLTPLLPLETRDV